MLVVRGWMVMTGVLSAVVPGHVDARVPAAGAGAVAPPPGSSSSSAAPPVATGAASASWASSSSGGPVVDEPPPLPPLPSEPPPNIPPAPPSVMRVQRTVDGTPVQVLVMAQPEQQDAARTVVDDALAEYARVLRLATAADGPVDRINRDAGVGPVGLPPEVVELVSEAVRICTLSNGAYDPTAAVYDALWPFDGSGPVQSPPLEELARRTTLVDCRQLKVDGASRTVQLLKPGMRVALREPARGLALDRAMDVMRQRGFGDAIFYAGGDAVVSGHKAGRRWMVGLQDPRGSGHFAALPVAGGAVFTAGDYEQGFLERGRRYHAVLDPRTGLPARGMRSVTVHARTGAEAAMLSRAVFVMGVEAGLRLVERLPHVEVVIVDERNRVWSSKSLSSTLKYRPPTDGN